MKWPLLLVALLLIPTGSAQTAQRTSITLAFPDLGTPLLEPGAPPINTTASVTFPCREFDLMPHAYAVRPTNGTSDANLVARLWFPQEPTEMTTSDCANGPLMTNRYQTIFGSLELSLIGAPAAYHTLSARVAASLVRITPLGEEVVGSSSIPILAQTAYVAGLEISPSRSEPLEVAHEQPVIASFDVLNLGNGPTRIKVASSSPLLTPFMGGEYEIEGPIAGLQRIDVPLMLDAFHLSIGQRVDFTLTFVGRYAGSLPDGATERNATVVVPMSAIVKEPTPPSTEDDDINAVPVPAPIWTLAALVGLAVIRSRRRGGGGV
jgi:hypothetical protein